MSPLVTEFSLSLPEFSLSLPEFSLSLPQFSLSFPNFPLVCPNFFLGGVTPPPPVATPCIKSLAHEESKLLRAQLNILFIALKLLSTVAVQTGNVFDISITLSKFGYNARSMFFPAAIKTFFL